MIICFKMCNFRAGYLNFYTVFAFTTALNARKSLNAFFIGVDVDARAFMALYDPMLLKASLFTIKINSVHCSITTVALQELKPLLPIVIDRLQ